jgi:hypothetical protein
MRSYIYCFFPFGAIGVEGPIIGLVVSPVILCAESDIIMCDVSPMFVIGAASPPGVDAAGFSPFEHPTTMAATTMTNAMRFMRAPRGKIPRKNSLNATLAARGVT